MKILHVIYNVDPKSGGPGNVTRNLVREQGEAGHQVSVLTTSAQIGEPWIDSRAYHDVVHEDSDLCHAEIYMARAYGRRRPFSTFSYSPEADRWLRQRLCDPQLAPDVVHIHDLFNHVAVAAARQARRHGVPYLVRPAGCLNTKCYRMGFHQLKRQFFRFYLRRCLDGATFVQATSPSEKRELQPWVAPDRIRVVPNGASVPTLNGAQDRLTFLGRYPQLRRKRVVLFMGRIAAKKRPAMLVEALASARGEFPDLVLLLVGNDAGQMATVSAMARRHGLEDSVVHVGFLQGQMKRAAFSAADLFALPSVDENFGVAVVEAMAHGVPVLVTPEVASHVYVERSRGGLAVKGTVEDVANGIRRLLREDRGVIGRNGRKYVEEHLAWPLVARKLEEVYRDMTLPEAWNAKSNAGNQSETVGTTCGDEPVVWS